MPRKTKQAGPASSETACYFNEAAARCRGKRHDAGGSERETDDTSMRPRLDAAENPREAEAEADDEATSMRPRLDAAENIGDVLIRSDCRDDFNEAAARCRGKRWPDSRASGSSSYFNEAAARCRGKRGQCDSGRTPQSDFNEAAARCRGKPRSRARPRTPTGCNFNEAAARCRGKRCRRGPGPCPASPLQ